MRKLTLPLLLLVSVSAAAWSSPPPPAFVQMVAKLHSLKTYQTVIQASIAVQQGKGAADQGGSVGFTEHIVYKAPNLLIVSIPDFLGGITIWSDGKQMYQYYGANNKYKQSAVPKDMIQQFTSMGSGTGMKAAGKGVVDHVAVDIVKGQGLQSGSLMTMWIGANDHLPRKIEVVMPKTSSTTSKTVMTQVFTNTILDKPLPTNGFKLKLPSNALKSGSGAEVPGGIGFSIPGAGD